MCVLPFCPRSKVWVNVCLSVLASQYVWAIIQSLRPSLRPLDVARGRAVGPVGPGLDAGLKPGVYLEATAKAEAKDEGGFLHRASR